MAFRSTRHHTISRVIAQTLQTYDRDALLFLKRWGKPRYKPPELLRDWLTCLPVRAVLLDLGCGGGQDTRYLKAAGHRVVGLDRTLSLLRFGQTRVPSATFVLADMRSLPLGAESLDGIWAAASLMHLPKTTMKDVLVKVRGCVRPGGVLAATVTYGTRSRIQERGWIPGRYFARWKKSELAGALRRAGWEILALHVVSNRERKGRWINVIARRV